MQAIGAPKVEGGRIGPEDPTVIDVVDPYRVGDEQLGGRVDIERRLFV